MPVKRALILEAWNSFRAAVYPPGTSAIQLEECRRAFYAGASSLWDAIFKCLDPGSDATKDDMDQMSAIAAEFDRYIAEMGRKAAEESIDFTRKHPRV